MFDKLEMVVPKGTRRVFGSSYIHVFYITRLQSGRHDLIDRVKSSPEQMKITASIYKHILCDDGSAACPGIDVSMQ